MKKMILVVLALTLTVGLFTIANAGYRNGPGGCCGDAGQQQDAASDQFSKFQADTMDLRQEMMTKRFDAQRENLKPAPDAGKIASIQADMDAIRAKIQEVRSKSGLPGCADDGACGKRCGAGAKNGMGDFGRGMGGCNSNNAPCGGQR